MAVDRFGNRLQAGTTPARSPRRKEVVKYRRPYCVWRETIEQDGNTLAVVRVYQNLHAVSATLAKTQWGKEECVVFIPMLSSSAEEEVSLRKLAMASALSQLYKRMEGKVVGKTASDPSFEGDYPGVYDFLALVELEGKSREPGTITLMCQDGRFKASMQDKETKHYCFVSADTFMGLLEAMEGALTNPEHEWRESKPFLHQGKRK